MVATFSHWANSHILQKKEYATMDSIMTFLKENYDLLSLAVGLIGVLVATLASTSR